MEPLQRLEGRVAVFVDENAGVAGLLPRILDLQLVPGGISIRGAVDKRAVTQRNRSHDSAIGDGQPETESVVTGAALVQQRRPSRWARIG
jgi:hypothetical protein